MPRTTLRVVTRIWVVSIHVVSLVSKTDKEYSRVVKRTWVVNIHVVRSLASKTDKEYFRVVRRTWVVNVHVVSCNVTRQKDCNQRIEIYKKKNWN